MEWTNTQIEILKSRYPKEGASKELCMVLKRNVFCIRKKAQLLSLRVDHDSLYNRNWSFEEIELLKEFYPTKGPNKKLQELLSRTAYSIRLKAEELGVERIFKWTESDIDILNKRYYQEGASEQLSRDLKRSKASIMAKAEQLNIFTIKKRKTWTSEEINILRQHFPSEGASKNLQKLLNRSQLAIFLEANKHGMKSQRPSGKNDPQFTGCEEISGQYIATIKDSAKKRSFTFNVSAEYLWDLYLNQGKKCALSGIELKFRGRNSNDTKKLQTASLDRIDSSMGYIEGNVQWVHKQINRMKWNLNDSQFVHLCKLVAKNNKVSE